MVDGFSPSGCMFSSTRDYTLTSKPLALYPRPPQTCQGGGVQAIADGRDVRCQRCRAFPRPASAFAKLWRRVGNSRCSATHWCLLTPWSTAFGTPLPRRRSRAPREGYVECTGFCLTILPIMLISFSSMIMRPSANLRLFMSKRGKPAWWRACSKVTGDLVSSADKASCNHTKLGLWHWRYFFGGV
jgi:hypothetical protein